MAGRLDTKSACKLNAESLSVDKEATEDSNIETRPGADCSATLVLYYDADETGLFKLLQMPVVQHTGI